MIGRTILGQFRTLPIVGLRFLHQRILRKDVHLQEDKKEFLSDKMRSALQCRTSASCDGFPHLPREGTDSVLDSFFNWAMIEVLTVVDIGRLKWG